MARLYSLRLRPTRTHRAVRRWVAPEPDPEPEPIPEAPVEEPEEAKPSRKAKAEDSDDG